MSRRCLPSHRQPLPSTTLSKSVKEALPTDISQHSLTSLISSISKEKKKLVLPPSPHTGYVLQGMSQRFQNGTSIACKLPVLGCSAPATLPADSSHSSRASRDAGTVVWAWGESANVS